MKKVVFSVLSVIFLFAGCQSENIRQPKTAAVLFPSEIAGVWKAEDSPWQIEISKKGQVVSAVIPMGTVKVWPNQETIMETEDGKKSRWTAGGFDAQYLPKERKLEVTIEMWEIHIVLGDDVLDGNSTDIFTGHISEDGKVWDTTWFNFFDYGDRFPMDPNVVGEPLRFHKQ
jgi:hypothetical protein